MGFGILFFWDCLEKYAHFRFWRGSGIFAFFGGGDCLDEYAHFVVYVGFGTFVFLGTVSKNILTSDFGEVPESLLVYCFGTVSKNMPMLISWPMGFGVFDAFWDCVQECAPVMTTGFLSFGHTSMSNLHVQLHMHAHAHVRDETSNTMPTHCTKQNDTNQSKQGIARSCARPWMVPAARAEGVDSVGGAGGTVCIYTHTRTHTQIYIYICIVIY